MVTKIRKVKKLDCTNIIFYRVKSLTNIVIKLRATPGIIIMNNINIKTRFHQDFFLFEIFRMYFNNYIQSKILTFPH